MFPATTPASATSSCIFEKQRYTKHNRAAATRTSDNAQKDNEQFIELRNCSERNVGSSTDYIVSKRSCANAVHYPSGDTTAATWTTGYTVVDTNGG